MRVILLVALLLLAWAVVSGAQDTSRSNRAVTRGTDITRGPVYVTDRVVFELRDMPIEKAVTMPVRLRVDSPATSTPYQTLTPPLNCVPMSPTVSLCDAPLPQETVTRLNQNGRRELYAFAWDGNCCESRPSNVWVIQGRRP